MRTLLLALVLSLAIPAFAVADGPAPTCESRSAQTTFAGADVDNCIHVSAYVCTDPHYFGGGGGKVPLYSNWVCDDRAYVTLP